MRRLLVALPLAALGCQDTAVECSGPKLFGRPNQSSGLTEDTCSPTCPCGGDEWTAPALDPDTLYNDEHHTAVDPLTDDPYEADPPAAPIPGEVCAVRIDPDGYSLLTYESAEAAEDAGTIMTHGGRCGLCSSMADLKVYVKFGDLTEPVRACGLDHLFGPREDHIRCLTELGFTEPCATIWYYNTIHTRQNCADECFTALDDPYHLPDGTLNDCLACDERQSGTVFKAVAGRTRRNSGLPTAICRPCETVLRLDHDYR